MTVDLAAPVLLESGDTLFPIAVYFEAWGLPFERADAPLVLVCHALTGDARAYRSDSGRPTGWWQGLIGPGRLLDPAHLRILCMAVLGGCGGTTGPTSIDPKTGAAYALTFPVITVRDMVTVQAAALSQLGLSHVDLAIGGSLGGMQALEWAETFPERVGMAVVIGATDRTPGHALALNALQREVICQDPRFDPERPRATRGLGVARALAMVSYRGPAHMDRQFGRRPSQRLAGPIEGASVHQGLSAVDDYLRHHAQAIRRRFDAHSYLYLMRAMDLHDTTRGRDHEVHTGAPVLFVGITTDILFPASAVRQSARRRRERGLPTAHLTFRSPYGHDAFLIDTDRLSVLIGPTIRRSLRLGHGPSEGGADLPASRHRLRRRLRLVPARPSRGEAPPKSPGPRSPAAK